MTKTEDKPASTIPAISDLGEPTVETRPHVHGYTDGVCPCGKTEPTSDIEETT